MPRRDPALDEAIREIAAPQQTPACAFGAVTRRGKKLTPPKQRASA